MRLLSKKDILLYEIDSSRWARYISNTYLQKLAASYFVNKVERKYSRYLAVNFLRESKKALLMSLTILLLSSCALHPSRQATFYRMDNIGLVVHIDTKYDIVWVRFDCSEATTRKRCYDIVGYDLKKLGYTEVGQQLKLQ